MAEEALKRQAALDEALRRDEEARRKEQEALNLKAAQAAAQAEAQRKAEAEAEAQKKAELLRKLAALDGGSDSRGTPTTTTSPQTTAVPRMLNDGPGLSATVHPEKRNEAVATIPAPVVVQPTVVATNDVTSSLPDWLQTTQAKETQGSATAPTDVPSSLESGMPQRAPRRELPRASQEFENLHRGLPARGIPAAGAPAGVATDGGVNGSRHGSGKSQRR